MALKIRLQRKGRKKKPFYHIVAADARAPRDGKFIEKLGTYNPLTVPATINLDADAAYAWLMQGAQPTDTVRAILKYKGVFYKKHLQRGVSKGSFDQETADKLLAEWIEAKEAKVEKRKVKTSDELEARRKKIFGNAPVKVVAEEVVEEVVVEETPATEAVVEETPATEAVVEETPATEAVVEETPADDVVVKETPADDTKA
jgi:small subunit ribosomal protein S16